MNDPFQELTAEHEAALAELTRLERAALALRADATSPEALATARHVLDVLRTTVRRHNEKEERALFPLLGNDAPVAVFEDEHRSLRALERQLGTLIETGGAGARVADVALEIAALLRNHIEREEIVLFPMARARLGPDGLANLARRMQ